MNQNLKYLIEDSLGISHDIMEFSLGISYDTIEVS